MPFGVTLRDFFAIKPRLFSSSEPAVPTESRVKPTDSKRDADPAHTSKSREGWFWSSKSTPEPTAVASSSTRSRSDTYSAFTFGKPMDLTKMETPTVSPVLTSVPPPRTLMLSNTPPMESVSVLDPAKPKITLITATSTREKPTKRKKYAKRMLRITLGKVMVTQTVLSKKFRLHWQEIQRLQSPAYYLSEFVRPQETASPTKKKASTTGKKRTLRSRRAGVSSNKYAKVITRHCLPVIDEVLQTPMAAHCVNASNPVDQYCAIVKDPICLLDIRELLQASMYKTLNEVMRDMVLLCNNNLTYFPAKTQERVFAIQLYHRLWSDMKRVSDYHARQCGAAMTVPHMEELPEHLQCTFSMYASYDHPNKRAKYLPAAVVRKIARNMGQIPEDWHYQWYNNASKQRS